MNLESLRELLKNAAWFQQLGEFRGKPGMLAIRDLEPWRTDDVGDSEEERVAASMEWLPSKVEMPDPFHGVSIRELADEQSKADALRKVSLEMYSAALTSLRSVTPHPLLKVGPHDFFRAARGAGAYAAKGAAGEVFLDQVGIWCSLLELFCEGFWPCGRLPDGTIVVL